MAAPSNTFRIHRPLTSAELDELLHRVNNADTVGALLSVAVAGLYGPLLTDLGETISDYGPDKRLDPRTFAIPQAQWTLIATAVTGRAQAWGLAAEVGLELVNVMPATYDDPNVTVPQRHQPDFRPEHYGLRISRDATDTIAACETHIAALAVFYGVLSPEYRSALDSWHQQLAGLFRVGFGERTDITADGTLSLLASTSSGFVFGIVFHGELRRCTVDGCRAAAGDSPDEPWRPIHPGSPVLDHDHAPSYPFDGPQPGTWSAHS
jgi:hypothetical protein